MGVNVGVGVFVGVGVGVGAGVGGCATGIWAITFFLSAAIESPFDNESEMIVLAADVLRPYFIAVARYRVSSTPSRNPSHWIVSMTPLVVG